MCISFWERPAPGMSRRAGPSRPLPTRAAPRRPSQPAGRGFCATRPPFMHRQEPGERPHPVVAAKGGREPRPRGPAYARRWPAPLIELWRRSPHPKIAARPIRLARRVDGRRAEQRRGEPRGPGEASMPVGEAGKITRDGERARAGHERWRRSPAPQGQDVGIPSMPKLGRGDNNRVQNSGSLHGTAVRLRRPAAPLPLPRPAAAPAARHAGPPPRILPHSSQPISPSR